MEQERICINVELTLVDEDSVKNYVNVLNGLAYVCNIGEYREGNRNEIALDLTVASYMLGMDALEILGLFIRHNLINPSWDDDSPIDRVTRALGYHGRFDWDYMINPRRYHLLGAGLDKRDLDNLPFVFVVSDSDKADQVDYMEPVC